MKLETLAVCSVRRLSLALVVGAVLCALMLGSAGSVHAAACGNSFIKGGRSGGAALGIKTKAVGCGEARKVVKQYSYLRGCPKGWNCKGKRSIITLKRAKGKISFEVVLNPVKQVSL